MAKALVISISLGFGTFHLPRKKENAVMPKTKDARKIETSEHE